MIWKVSIYEIRIFFLLTRSLLRGTFRVKRLIDLRSYVIEWEFFRLNSCRIVFTLVLDWVSLIFISFVFLISRRVIYYSGSYISIDKNINRFIYLVLLFVGSISFIVLSPNLVRILLGWDGLGLVSYALVIFYQNEKSAAAGILTILSNRVGDIAILLGIALIIKLGGWNFFLYRFYINDEWIILKTLVILRAITKRAQIPFSAWLPAAIAAPTPVSALVHSSTLVTAGVYLIIRFRPALERSRGEKILLIIATLTIFMAGLGANFEYDLKKIIALSTLRQLGLILRILSLGFPDLAFFHLLAHALFKALLFICAGVVIHRVGDYQDIRCIGGLIRFIPLTISFIVVANLALCGFPFLAGFYSKDIILEVAFIRAINSLIFLLFVVSTILTVIYTIRLLYYRLTGEFNLSSLGSVRDEDHIIVRSIRGLGLGGILGGRVLAWLIFPERFIICISIRIKIIVLVVRILGGVLGYLLNNINKINYSLKSIRIYIETVIIGSIWFIPFLRTKKMREVRLRLGQRIQKVGDKGWFEYFGGQGLNKVLFNIFLLQIFL